MSIGLLPWILAATAILALARSANGRRRLHVRLERVARACHELRGALAAMGLALARIEEAPDAGVRMESVEALRTQQARALQATEDLEAVRGEPHLTNLESGSPVDLEALVRRCVRAWAATHGRWRVVLDWRAGRPTVWGQAGRLGQALDNLIANALEHGTGPVTVVGRLTGDSVTVAVLDRGSGLRQSLADGGNGSWRERRGHGLVIVRRAVDEHGGRMQLVRESRGTGVQIRLPLAPESPVAGASGGVRPVAGTPGVAPTT